MNKKITIAFVVFALMIILPPIDAVMGDNDRAQINMMDGNNPENGSMIRNRTREEIQTRNFTTDQGKEVAVRIEGLLYPEIQAGKNIARCEEDCMLESEDMDGKTKLFFKSQGGQSSEIKIMPDTASINALQRLRIKNCNESNGCNIELKQTGVGNQSRLMYEVTAQKQSKLFGLFAKKMQVNAEVDAETGEVVKAKKPWWAFLASETDEKPEMIE